jgi:type I restriction enzyme, S subunit
MSISPVYTWECETFGSVAVFINGYPFAPYEHGQNGLPIIRIEQLKDRNAPADKYDAELPERFLLHNGDIVFSWSGSFEVRRWDRGPAWLNQHLFRVLPRPAVRPEFLYHLLNWSIEALSRQSHGTTMSHITRPVLLRHPVLLPPEREQRLIAEILDTTDQRIRSSISSTQKLDELRRAAIRESMRPGLECLREVEASELHDGARRGIGSWSLVPLYSLLNAIDAGHSPDLEDTPAGPGQWGVLKVSAVGNGVFRPGENKVVDARALCNPTICVYPGDLLMTRANTTQLVGLSCIVDDTPPHLMLCDKTLRLKVAHPYATTNYVQIVLGADEVRRQIEIEATGTSGSMKNISQQSIRRLMIPLGSAEDVNRVTTVDALFRAQLGSMRREVGRLQALKQGLMDDLLTGRVRMADAEMEHVGTG